MTTLVSAELKAVWSLSALLRSHQTGGVNGVCLGSDNRSVSEVSDD
jgi:hypothetical protein